MPLPAPHTLFEVSWEVCNKVGGIHTVVSSKARTLALRFGDQYVVIGPWLLSEGDAPLPFRDEGGFEPFIEACRAEGVPVRVGRWLIPGEPRTILVAFSDLYTLKDGILSGLWERHQVDSLTGGWDYVEPVLFAHAAGIVIRRWWQTYRAGLEQRAVAQFHEWMTGAGLLFLADQVPEIATVFTTHATVLGRAAGSQGIDLAEVAPGALADRLHVQSKHSIEGATARAADVFTTVSAITADEAELVHGRRPEPLLPNGIDLAVIDDLIDGVSRDQAEHALRDFAARFLGADVSDAVLLATSGRYEFRNKGIEVLLEALGTLNHRPGHRVVLFVLVPAGNSGVRGELLQRLALPVSECHGPIGIATHNLFDPLGDPIQVRCAALGLDNAPDARVKVIHVPLYLHAGDGLLDLPYEAVLQAMDLTCFPSWYEPWGYTPQESLAVGVPTVTSDCAGFGRWCLSQGLGPDDGVRVLYRQGASDREAAERLSYLLAAHLAEPASRDAQVEACRRTAQRTAWADLIANYEHAFALALERSAGRDGHLVAPSFTTAVTVAPRPGAERQRPRLIPFDVSATLPAPLAPLARLARNLWWAGDPEAQCLFVDLAPGLWEATGHNPVALLRRAAIEDLAARAADRSYVDRLTRIMGRFDAYVARPVVPLTGDGSVVASPERPIAYFCAEFGLHESLPIYSGGLGVLAGDHLKSASDLGVPLVAVGLLYRQGYFRQRLTASGQQMAAYNEIDVRDLPLEPVHAASGERLQLSLALPGGAVALQAWQAQVGRVTLYLLDANVPENRPEDRDITRVLYGGDSEMRLRQEIVLGKGGVRLLREVGLHPAVFHLNEGHAALAGLERISGLLRDEGLTFEEAREVVRATTAFTTHTPVAAGHDRFTPDLMRRYFADAPTWIGVPWDRFCALGERPDEPGTFNMTGLALNLAGFVNGVSRLHQAVSRDLLAAFWPGRLAHEVPIHGITNGVHLPTWTHPDVASLLDAADRAVVAADFARASGDLDGARLWAVRCAARERLLRRAMAHIERRFVERHDSPRLLTEMVEGLEEPGALVIGFARRFAPYKRAHLLFKDPDRLAALLDRPGQPVRILLAGKAHPNDGLGQELLARVVALSREVRFVGKVVFLEDHDIALGRLLVQGVDVWLNTPEHRMEASGTSGMKAAANGALNVSILDGWWAEGYDGTNGWAIGGERVFDAQELQDELDSANLLHLLEDEVVPLFFERDATGVPRRWLERVRHSLGTIPPRFGADRMVADYLAQAYLPLAREGVRLADDAYRADRDRVARIERVRRAFGELEIVTAQIADLDNVQAGDTIAARVEVRLASLAPEDVLVELVLGRAGDGGELTDVQAAELAPAGPPVDGVGTFTGSREVARAGSFAYGIRVRGRGETAGDDPDDPVIWA
jgi:glycogen phosphorylase/synthase